MCGCGGVLRPLMWVAENCNASEVEDSNVQGAYVGMSLGMRAVMCGGC